MEALFRILAIISGLVVIGTPGNIEWGFMTRMEGFFRMMLFILLAAIFHCCAEHIRDKKRKKRRAYRSTSSVSSNKNVELTTKSV